MKNIKDRLTKSDQFYGFSEFIDSRKSDFRKKDLVLCDISPASYRPFYLGANIIDAVVNESEISCGRAIWEPGFESMEWFTENPVRDFGIIGICAYMYYQIFGIPAFLHDNKIQPISKFRKESDPIILLGGQANYLFSGYDKFVDIACVGEGEKFILSLIDLKKNHIGSRSEFLEKASRIPGSYVPSIHGSSPEPVISKTFLQPEELSDFSRLKTLKTKCKAHVIEVARGCKYQCGFCSLSRRMHPFREIPAEVINKKINTFAEDEHIYPFAPDEASYSGRETVVNWCEARGLKVYHYNYRLNTISKKDVENPGLGGNIVFGIDGISQRIIDIIGKGINLKRLEEEIAPLVFENGFNTIKLNYVFNFPYETEEDYEQLYLFWKRLIEIRIEKKSKCFIHIAPTPFLPEYFIPLQFAPVRNNINPLFEETLKRVKTHFFDKLGVEPRIKAEGLQGYENWITSVLMHRIENLSDFVYYAFKNGYKKSGYDKKLFNLMNQWLISQGKSKSKLLEELDPSCNYWFDKFDWSGGTLDYKKKIRQHYLSIKKLSERETRKCQK